MCSFIRGIQENPAYPSSFLNHYVVVLSVAYFLAAIAPLVERKLKPKDYGQIMAIPSLV
jgi:hypothetical protein